MVSVADIPTCILMRTMSTIHLMPDRADKKTVQIVDRMPERYIDCPDTALADRCWADTTPTVPDKFPPDRSTMWADT